MSSTLVITILVLVSALCITAGIYINYGAGSALIALGVEAIVVAALIARGSYA